MPRARITRDEYEENWEGDGGYTILDPGSYDLRIDSVDEELSQGGKTAGQAKWTVNCVVVGGECDGATFKMWMYPESKAAFRVAALMKAIDVEPYVDDDDLIVDTDDFVNRVFRAQVTKRVYEGKDKNEVESFLRSDKDPGKEQARKQSSGSSDMVTAADIPF